MQSVFVLWTSCLEKNKKTKIWKKFGKHEKTIWSRYFIIRKTVFTKIPRWSKMMLLSETKLLCSALNDTRFCWQTLRSLLNQHFKIRHHFFKLGDMTLHEKQPYSRSKNSPFCCSTCFTYHVWLFTRVDVLYSVKVISDFIAFHGLFACYCCWPIPCCFSNMKHSSVKHDCNMSPLSVSKDGRFITEHNYWNSDEKWEYRAYMQYKPRPVRCQIKHIFY